MATVAALAVPIGAMAGAEGQVSEPAVVPVVVVDGKGFGHGVGMAQEGAYWMGVAGASTAQILGQFYPGAGIGKGRGSVRIPVLDAGTSPTSALLAFPAGGEVRETGSAPSSAGFPVRFAPGGQVRIVFENGRYRAEPLGGVLAASAPGTSASIDSLTADPLAARPADARYQVPTIPDASTTTTSPAPSTSTPATSTTTTVAPLPTTTSTPPSSTTTAPTTTSPPPTSSPPAARTSSRSLITIVPDGATVLLPDRQRQYRGTVEATAASGTLRFVNTVDVEAYLKGMGEVRDPSWPQAALRAQAIAARTYALRAMAAGGEICDTQRCQVYLGAQAEYAAMNKAVDDSREQVLAYGRSLISAVYSANGGGYSANREEGFGVADGPDAPYLRAAPYPTRDPGPWTSIVALSDVAARLGYAGTITDVRVERRGPSGRALEVVLDGDRGAKSVTGITFDAALGLRSTLFDVRIDTGAAPPPPPAEAPLAQAPPDEAAAVARSEVAGRADRVRPTPPTSSAAGGRRSSASEEWTIVAAWALLALVGAVVVLLQPHITRRQG